MTVPNVCEYASKACDSDNAVLRFCTAANRTSGVCERAWFECGALENSMDYQVKSKRLEINDEGTNARNTTLVVSHFIAGHATEEMGHR